MKFKEIKKLNQTDLKKKLAEQQVKLRELRFSVANNQLKNLKEVKQVKRTIARILTILNNNIKESEMTKADKPVTDKKPKNNLSTSLEAGKEKVSATK